MDAKIKWVDVLVENKMLKEAAMKCANKRL